MAMPFVLSLGSNVGNSAAVLRDAVDWLVESDDIEITGVSSLYRTAPVGGVEQPDYLNAVVAGRTELSASDLLALCQRIEQAHGRTRDVRWGPRTLDLDVLRFGDVVSDDPRLTLPHPRAHERAFVLVPWFEVDADASVPGRGRVADLLGAVATDGVRLGGDADWPFGRPGDDRG